MRDLTFIDMFSGAGLFSAGFADQGARPVLAVDVSKEAIASYNRNVAPVGIARSVTDEMEIPFADILIAGPPCQGFSTLGRRSEEHTSELQSLMRISYAVFCLKNKNKKVT